MVQSIALRWEKSTRYYRAILHRDLLDTWVIFIMWGSKLSALGRSQHVPMRSFSEGLIRLHQINQHRIRRGYQVVDYDGNKEKLNQVLGHKSKNKEPLLGLTQI